MSKSYRSDRSECNPYGKDDDAMALMDLLVSRVLDEIRPMLTPDGGGVDLLSCQDGIVKVSYLVGSNEDCVECVMPPAEFELYLADLLKERVTGVTEVEVVESPA
jgi:Fe-S cluster biogenesis protein NfuA